MTNNTNYFIKKVFILKSERSKKTRKSCFNFTTSVYPLPTSTVAWQAARRCKAVTGKRPRINSEKPRIKKEKSTDKQILQHAGTYLDPMNDRDR